MDSMEITVYSTVKNNSTVAIATDRDWPRSPLSGKWSEDRSYLEVTYTGDMENGIPIPYIKKYPKEAVRELKLTVREYTGVDAFIVQKDLSALGRSPAQGNPVDTSSDAFVVAKSMVLARVLVTDWNRTQIIDGIESKLSCTAENIQKLPYSILMMLAIDGRLANGDAYSDEELSTLKKDSAPNTPNT
jgi:hypothetical protein